MKYKLKTDLSHEVIIELLERGLITEKKKTLFGEIKDTIDSILLIEFKGQKTVDFSASDIKSILKLDYSAKDIGCSMIRIGYSSVVKRTTSGTKRVFIS